MADLEESSDGSSDDDLSDSPRRHPGRPRASLVLAAVLSLATLVVVIAAPAGARHEVAPPSAATASAPSTGSTGSVGQADPLRLSLTQPAGSSLGDVPSQAVIARILDLRSAAVLAKDERTYVDTSLDTPSVRAEATAEADALAALPVAAWSYSSGAGADGQSEIDVDATEVARHQFGPSAAVVDTTLLYRLGGFDRTMVRSMHAVTLVERDGAWGIASDVPVDGSRELWQLGPLDVIQGARSTVIGLGVGAPGPAVLETYAAESDRAVLGVTAVWGPHWQRRVLVIVPATVGVLARELGSSPSSFSQIAALTTAEISGDAPVSRGDRVFVNPHTFGTLGPNGRTIVLRHEFTHVATAAARDDPMPTWMEEGFADYVGYLHSGVATSLIVRELSESVDRGVLPRTLPSDAAFSDANRNLPAVYEESWLACHIIAARYGQARLVALYAAMNADTTSDPAHGVDRAFRSELGLSYDSFLRSWRTQVAAVGR